MGALAHYLETEGISTTQISLIKEHTEIIQPPRALWVLFALGRPLGRPGDPAFQTRVILAAQDLKTAYFESVMIRPDMTLPDDTAFNRWFWQKTAAGEVLRAVRDKCRTAGDAAMKMNGDLLLVPMDQTAS